MGAGPGREGNWLRRHFYSTDTMPTIKDPPRDKHAASRTRHGRIQSSRARAGRPSYGSIPYLALALVTLVVYGGVVHCPFTNYDDNGYVTENQHVQAGLSWSTIAWSFTSIEQANWHPLTWLSHALDCQLYGLDAGGHHTTSLFIHVSNVLLLFVLLRKATECRGFSFVVAALFAWHPINVQSVAWVAERKNVLSTFFLLPALAAYGWYVRQPNVKRYALVVVAFVCGLASKAMVVTLPALLLIVDFWPLGRIEGWYQSVAASSVKQEKLRGLVIEKLPLLVLSGLSAFITVVAQRAHGAVQTSADFPLLSRLQNAFLSYAKYIGKAFWPTRFAVYYPSSFDPTFVQHPGRGIVLLSATAAVCLGIVSLAAWRQRVKRPYLTAGWAWFLVALLPVIGIVQVGRQAMADRYAYLPLVGIFVATVWGIAELAKELQLNRTVQRASVAAALCILAILSWREVGNWSSSYQLWTHALDVTTNNYVAESELGNVLVMERRYEEALPHYQRAAALDAEDAESRVNMGTIYEAAALHQQAAEQYQNAIAILSRPESGPVPKSTLFAATWSLGNTSVGLRDYEKAMQSYGRARSIDPESFHSYGEKLREALSVQPSAGGYKMLGFVLREEGRGEESAAAFQQAQHLDPDAAPVATGNLHAIRK